MTAFLEVMIKVYGAPLATLLLIVFGYLRFTNNLDEHHARVDLALQSIVKDVDHIKKNVEGIESTTASCKRARQMIEGDLHDRITKVQDRTSRIEGRLNGGPK